MKTINRSQILKNAWKLVKAEGLTLSAALKRAWAFAKQTISRLFSTEGLEVKSVEGGFNVSFPYDNDYVAAIKKLSVRTWNAATKTWFIGATAAEILEVAECIQGRNNQAVAMRGFLKEVSFQARNVA